MIKLMKRRDFIKQTLVASSCVLGSSVKIAEAIDYSMLEIDPEVKYECLEVYAAWLKVERESPYDYLSKTVFNTSGNICSQICQDQISLGDMMEIKGLTLTKIEAAVIAYLGSLIVS